MDQSRMVDKNISNEIGLLLTNYTNFYTILIAKTSILYLYLVDFGELRQN